MDLFPWDLPGRPDTPAVQTTPIPTTWPLTLKDRRGRRTDCSYLHTSPPCWFLVIFASAGGTSYYSMPYRIWDLRTRRRLPTTCHTAYPLPTKPVIYLLAICPFCWPCVSACLLPAFCSGHYAAPWRCHFARIFHGCAVPAGCVAATLPATTTAPRHSPFPRDLHLLVRHPTWTLPTTRHCLHCLHASLHVWHNMSADTSFFAVPYLCILVLVCAFYHTPSPYIPLLLPHLPPHHTPLLLFPTPYPPSTCVHSMPL